MIYIIVSILKVKYVINPCPKIINDNPLTPYFMKYWKKYPKEGTEK